MIQEAITDIIMGVGELARRVFLILLVTVVWSAGYLYDCITHVLGIGEK